MKRTAIQNLQKGFGFSLLILIISSIASFLSIQSLSNKAEWMSHTSRVLQQSERISSLLKDAETGQRGYLLTNTDSFLAPYRLATQTIYNSLNTLTELTQDNPAQQANCRKLYDLIATRMARLSELIRVQRTGKTLDKNDLVEGQNIMIATRNLIAFIQSDEQLLLRERTQSFDLWAWLSPLIIIITSLLAITITVFFYRQIKQDYEKRFLLQETLQRNEKETIDHIRIIEDVASQISSGNYEIRVSDTDKGSLGTIAVSLNKMAASLYESFRDLQSREWLKAGTAELSNLIIGEKDIQNLSKKIVKHITDYTGSQAAAMYLFDNNSLNLAAGVALTNNIKRKISLGEGLVGKSAEDEKTIVLNNMPQGDIVISYAAGEVKPHNLIVFPVIWENELKAVVETVSFQSYTNREQQWFESIAANIGLAIESAGQHTHLQQLLSETQAQAEELQMQQHELEQLNYDLENQAQKLQVSEEELKVQQEELLQANQELEERSSMLEEKNQMIVERNLEIQKKAEELEVSTKYKSEFLANMSHELRTPLNSILLLSRLIADNTEKNLTTEQVEFATVIQNSGNGLLTLIDEILDLSKIEAGKMKVEFLDVNVAGIKNNLMALFAPVAKEKNLSFEVEISNDAPLKIYTDSLRLEQILKNLISNAIKFTSAGEIKMKITSAPNDNISFTVSDTGIGISPEKQFLVFEAFQQEDGSTRRRFGGTGLGLSISRELAKILGGAITLKSAMGKGSEFTLIIPVAGNNQLIEEKIEMQVADAQKSIAEEMPVVSNISLSDETGLVIVDDRDNIKTGDKIILIIEDDSIFAKTLLTFAHKNKYKGLIALQGDHGLLLAKQFLPSAILLDIKLPVKNGWQVMDELKNNSATKNIPVHMMSSMHAEEESLSRGAINFIDKSATLEKLPQIFTKIEEALLRGPKKILIVEENEKHAQALCYFLESYNINVKGTQEIDDAVKILQDGSADCVVLEMKVFNNSAYEALEEVKNAAGLEHLPIIIFTGKSLSKSEEIRIKQVADSIVVKTANSYKRILDEIDVFLQIVEENDPSRIKSSTRRLSALEPVLENKTVLIADDDVRNIYSLTKALEAHKMIVISATDGKDALEHLKQNPKVNIVLMDMMMPEMDGYEATQAIRNMPQYRNLPVLAVTAKAMYGDREKCVQAGASDYISKPIDVDQLISLLRVWLYQ